MFPIVPNHSESKAPKITIELKWLFWDNCFEHLISYFFKNPRDLVISGLVQLERLRLSSKLKSIEDQFSNLKNLNLESLFNLKTDLDSIISETQQKIIFSM